MNGYRPIADEFGQLATMRPGIATIHNSTCAPINGNGLNSKVQLLELCARIGYTPHT